jgi:hypothetical protein
MSTQLITVAGGVVNNYPHGCLVIDWDNVTDDKELAESLISEIAGPRWNLDAADREYIKDTIYELWPELDPQKYYRGDVDRMPGYVAVVGRNGMVSASFAKSHMDVMDHAEAHAYKLNQEI